MSDKDLLVLFTFVERGWMSPTGAVTVVAHANKDAAMRGEGIVIPPSSRCKPLPK